MAINNQQKFAEVFLRFGQVPLGSNPQAKASLEEISFDTQSVPDFVTDRLVEDDVLTLADSYGDPMVGDPATFDFLRVKTTDGTKKEIEVYNLAIIMFMDNRDETRRLFRIVNTIKGKAIHS